MDTAAIYHRPESEYAFLYTNTKFRIRLRTRKNDIKKVYVLSGDPYTITTEKWYQKDMQKHRDPFWDNLKKKEIVKLSKL